MTLRVISALSLLGILMLLTASGCNKGAPEAAQPAPGPAPMQPPMATPNPPAPVAVPGQFAAARTTFDTHCVRCHSIEPGGAMSGGKMPFPGGPDKGPPPDKKFGPPGGFKGMMKGPNLAKVGADPQHTREWLISFIRDPQSQKANPRMPKFEGKLSDNELGALADYLGSLK